MERGDYRTDDGKGREASHGSCCNPGAILGVVSLGVWWGETVNVGLQQQPLSFRV